MDCKKIIVFAISSPDKYEIWGRNAGYDYENISWPGSKGL